ncbi:MAG: hypothetical protein HZB38_00625 [Planctomycetes bacterium]|nr:hypothetical protein [Planctomycetota bacterium]
MPRTWILCTWIAATTALAQQPAPAPPPQPAQPPVAQTSRMVLTAADALKETRVVALKKAQAAEVAHVLKSPMELYGLTRLAVDDRTNSLIVASDSADAVAGVIRLVEQLDQDAMPAAEDAIESVALSSTDAKDVAGALQRLVRNVRVQIVAEEHGNSLWLSGQAVEVKKLVEVAKRMDAGAARRAEDHREVRYYKLNHARADLLAGTLARTAAMMSLDVPIVADSPSATIIAFAGPDDHARLAAIVERLDVAPRNAPIREDARPDGPAPRPADKQP